MCGDDWHACIASDLERVEQVIGDSGVSDSPELAEMCRYVLSNHGKRVRSALCMLAFRACGGTDAEKAVNVAAAVELIHNATLIHDDINDKGDLRRGAKALYREYSIGKSIVCGDFMFAMGFKLLGTSDRLSDYFIDAASGLAAGEFDQKDYERSASADEAAYLKIISGKTACLIECAAKCGAHIAGGDTGQVEAFGRFAFKAGQAFQITDDILDVQGDASVTGKRVGDDIVEGKPTLPIIYAMADGMSGAEVRRIFQDPGSGYEGAARAIELIGKTDSIARCRRLARSIADSAKGEIDDIPGSVYKDSALALVDYMVSRDR